MVSGCVSDWLFFAVAGAGICLLLSLMVLVLLAWHAEERYAAKQRRKSAWNEHTNR